MGIPFSQDSTLFSLPCLDSQWEILPHFALKHWQLIFEKIDQQDILSTDFYGFPKFLPLDSQSANLITGLCYSFQGNASPELVFTVCPWGYNGLMLGKTTSILGMVSQSVQHVVNTDRESKFSLMSDSCVFNCIVCFLILYVGL